MPKDGRTIVNQGPETTLPRADGLPAEDQLSDGHLLERYTLHQDERAFAHLIRRHGPLVLGVCQRVLQDQHAAEDAFQATFLALALQGATLKQDGPLGSWLYTVAFRTARKLKVASVRRQAIEKQAMQMSAPRPDDEVLQNELRSVVDEEINQLQDKYRDLLVRVYLEGKPHHQVAEELGWPSGSVSRRIARAHELLRVRLARRGIVLSTALLLVLLSKATAKTAVSASLIKATLKATSVGITGAMAASGAGSGMVAAFVAALLNALLRLAHLQISKKLAFVLILLATVGTGTGMVVHRNWRPGQTLLTATEPDDEILPGMGRCGCSRLGWQSINILNGNQGSVLALAFVSSGRVLIATEDLGKAPPIRIWDTDVGNQARTLVGSTGPFLAAAFSPGAQLLAAAGDGQAIKLSDPITGIERIALEGHDGKVLALAFTADGKLLASGGLDGTVRLWDVATGEQRACIAGDMGPISALTFSRDGSVLAAGSRSGTLKLWDAGTQKERAATQRAHTDIISSLAFAPNGNALVSASWDRTLKSWSVALKQQVTFIGHSDQVCCVAFAPDGRTLVSGSRDKTARLWHLATGRSLAPLQGHTGPVEVLAFDRSGTRLVTGSSDQTVKLWKSEPARLPRFVR